jgi:hypothetical protein
MQNKIHSLTETITKALGPIFRENPEYNTILNAMCLVMARVVQATPDKGQELATLDGAVGLIKHALNEYIALEAKLEAVKVKQDQVIDRGIDAFTFLAEEKGEEL